MHRFVMLLTCLLVNEPRTNTFNLHTRCGLLLNVFNKHTLKMGHERSALMRLLGTHGRANDLRTDVEVPDRLESYRNLLFWPFSLHR